MVLERDAFHYSNGFRLHRGRCSQCVSVPGHHVHAEGLCPASRVRRSGAADVQLERRPGQVKLASLLMLSPQVGCSASLFAVCLQTRCRVSDRQTGAHGLRGTEITERYSQKRGADDGGGAGAHE